MLGGYTFPWGPNNFTLPRPRRAYAVGQSLGLVDIVRYPSLIVGEEIVMEWEWMSEAQYDQLLVIHKTMTNITWFPDKSFPAGVRYPDPDHPSRIYHSVVTDSSNPVQSVQQHFEVGWTAQRYDTFAQATVTATGGAGNYWFEVDAWIGDMPEAGTWVVHYVGVADQGTYISPWGEPYRSAAIYPDPATPERVWISMKQGSPFVVGNFIWDFVSNQTAQVDAVGENYLDVSVTVPSGDPDPMYPVGKTDASGFWFHGTGGRQAYTLMRGGLEWPLGSGADDEYEVRTTFFEGDLFETAHYEQPYRRGVRMGLNIREQVA